MLAAAGPVAAQGARSKADLFVGYSFLAANEINDWPREDTNGFQATVAAHLGRTFGIVGDVGIHAGTVHLDPLQYPPTLFPSTVHVRVYEYLAGARFTARGRTVSAFAHALAGGVTGHSDMGGFSSNSGFAFGGGGGIDVRIAEPVAVRAQFDYLFSLAEMVENDPRISVGIVVGLGGR